MRAMLNRVPALQGVAGVCCVTAGAYVLAGVGVALVAFGVFLLVGAWGVR